MVRAKATDSRSAPCVRGRDALQTRSALVAPCQAHLDVLHVAREPLRVVRLHHVVHLAQEPHGPRVHDLDPVRRHLPARTGRDTPPSALTSQEVGGATRRSRRRSLPISRARGRAGPCARLKSRLGCRGRANKGAHAARGCPRPHLWRHEERDVAHEEEVERHLLQHARALHLDGHLPPVVLEDRAVDLRGHASGGRAGLCRAPELRQTRAS